MEPAAVVHHSDLASAEADTPGAQAWLAVAPDAAGWAGPRRVLNLVASLLLLVATAPLWLLIAALVKATSRGPVLYKQVRVGIDKRVSGMRHSGPPRRHDLGGRPFTMYKFRTMRVDAEANTGAVWATADDPRVTPIGRWLRQYRLDELPQLINVVRGEMNLVGPRPERPTIVEALRKEIPHYQVRQRALPGITGHAQVSLEYDSSIDTVRRKVDHDIAYIQRASAWEDMKIILKTIPVMLFRRGAR